MNKGDQPINIGPLIQGWSSLHDLYTQELIANLLEILNSTCL